MRFLTFAPAMVALFVVIEALGSPDDQRCYTLAEVTSALEFALRTLSSHNSSIEKAESSNKRPSGTQQITDVPGQSVPLSVPHDGYAKYARLEIHPTPNLHGTIIFYTTKEIDSFRNMTDELGSFIRDHAVVNRNEFSTRCDFGRPPATGKVCAFDVGTLGNQCVTENQFGYARGKPCVFLELKAPKGWVPEPYDDVDFLPPIMPDELKDHIRLKATENKEQLKMIWVSCEGEYSADREHIGNVVFTPFRGFPTYYFPDEGTPGYLSPIVALQFENPERGVLINIECKAWAKNIIHDRERGLGSIIFELLIDV